MSKLDNAIQEALTEEDAEFLARLNEEPGAIKQFMGIFNGPLSWILVLFLIGAVIFGFVGLYAAWQFGTATTMRPLFYWGAVIGLCIAAISVVRIVFFIQFNTNRMLREMKKLELQVAQLAARMER